MNGVHCQTSATMIENMARSASPAQAWSGKPSWNMISLRTPNCGS
jgi:hypothetical protein